MAEHKAVRDPGRVPSHPGEVIADILLDIPHKKTELANSLGISRQHFYDILNARKPVSPKIAAKIGKMFGGGAGIWLRMQAAHDAWHVEREVDVSDIPALATT